MSGELSEYHREVEACLKRECWDVKRIETTSVACEKGGGAQSSMFRRNQIFRPTNSAFAEQLSASHSGHRSPISSVR
jgi:hypothetical protein